MSSLIKNLIVVIFKSSRDLNSLTFTLMHAHAHKSLTRNIFAQHVALDVCNAVLHKMQT